MGKKVMRVILMLMPFVLGGILILIAESKNQIPKDAKLLGTYDFQAVAVHIGNSKYFNGKRTVSKVEYYVKCKGQVEDVTLTIMEPVLGQTEMEQAVAEKRIFSKKVYKDDEGEYYFK